MRLTANSGMLLPLTVADRTPRVVLSTKCVAVTVLPECVNFSPPLWVICPFKPARVSVPLVTGKLNAPDGAALPGKTAPFEVTVAGETGLTRTPAFFNACTVDAPSTSTVFLPVTPIVLAVAMGFGWGVLLELAELHPAATTPASASASATVARGARIRQII